MRGDHRAVVAAVFQLGQKDLCAELLCAVVDQLAQTAIGGDAAGQHDLPGVCVRRRGQQLFGQDLVDALLKARGHVGHVHGLALLLGVVDLIDDGGFQAAEAHVVLAVHMGHGQLVRLGVAVPRRRGHAGAAGVGQTQRAGDLVVGLARGVVHGAA